MARWRLITSILIILALALWVLVFVLSLRPELGRGVSRGFLLPAQILRLQAPLSGLASWVSSIELIITLFLAGMANFYLFPARVRNMQNTLELGWSRALSLTLIGIGFGFLLVVFAVGAALARITFPFTVLSALALIFLCLWGFLGAAYTAGHLLLSKAGWSRRLPAIDLALGLLLLLPLARMPYAGGVVLIIYMGLGLGLVIVTRFGSNESWSLIPLLEEDIE